MDCNLGILSMLPVYVPVESSGRCNPTFTFVGGERALPEPAEHTMGSFFGTSQLAAPTSRSEAAKTIDVQVELKKRAPNSIGFSSFSFMFHYLCLIKWSCKNPTSVRKFHPSPTPSHRHPPLGPRMPEAGQPLRGR